MNIYYLSANGTKIDFKGMTYRIQTGDMFAYEWGFESTSYANRNGGTINRFTRGITKKEITIAVTARNQALYYDALNRLFEIVESDVRNLTPGRLFVGDYYLSCYLYKSKKSNWESGAPFLDNVLYIVTEYPFWCSEKVFHFYPQNATQVSGDYLGYPFGYSYGYTRDLTTAYLENDNYSASDFKLTIYGPCVNPNIVIDGNIYEAQTVLYEGEYLVVDSRDKTIIRTRYNGIKVNEFNARNKLYDVFAQIPAGQSVVSWNTSFGFDILLFQERSEPKWKS